MCIMYVIYSDDATDTTETHRMSKVLNIRFPLDEKEYRALLQRMRVAAALAGHASVSAWIRALIDGALKKEKRTRGS